MTLFRFLSCLLCCIFGTSCATDTPPLVLVSVAAYQEIVQEMAGSQINVQTVVPSGMSFHSYEPTPGHMTQLSSSKLWLTIGAAFEQKILKALEQTGRPPAVVDLRSGLTLLHDTDCQGGHEATDTHIWTSPRMMKAQLVTIRRALESVFPTKKDEIKERYEALVGRIDDLIKETDEQLSGASGTIIVIAHGAYDYLCHDYGIEQRAIEVGGKEATARSLLDLIEEAKSRGVKTVFSLKQYPKKGIQRVAEELHAAIVELDAYQPNYCISMRYTVDAIHNALKEEKQ